MSKQSFNQQSTQTKGMINSLLILSCALLIVAQSAGCSSISRLGFGEAVAISYRDMVWAKRAYNLRFGNCDRQYEEHFQSGFCSGYTDVANGGDGYTPALPPSDYRASEFQSADGAQCVNSWFEGYPEGVAAAKKDNVGTFHDVLISRMIDTAVKQEKTKSVLPATIPIVSASHQRTGVPIIQAPTRTTLPPIMTKSQVGLPPIVGADSGNAIGLVPGFIPQASNDTQQTKSELAPEIAVTSYNASVDAPELEIEETTTDDSVSSRK